MDKGHERRPLRYLKNLDLNLELAHVLDLHLSTTDRWKAFPLEYGAPFIGAPFLAGGWR